MLYAQLQQPAAVGYAGRMKEKDITETMQPMGGMQDPTGCRCMKPKIRTKRRERWVGDTVPRLGCHPPTDYAAQPMFGPTTRQNNHKHTTSRQGTSTDASNKERFFGSRSPRARQNDKQVGGKARFCLAHTPEHPGGKRVTKRHLSVVLFVVVVRCFALTPFEA